MNDDRHFSEQSHLNEKILVQQYLFVSHSKELSIAVLFSLLPDRRLFFEEILCDISFLYLFFVVINWIHYVLYANSSQKLSIFDIFS